MSVNGKLCWSKTGLVGTSGTQKCGGGFKEERFQVRDCYATLEANTPLTVRVWTSLDGDARDESFAINDVVIQLLGKGISGVICVRGTIRRCSFRLVIFLLLYPLLPVRFIIGSKTCNLRVDIL